MTMFLFKSFHYNVGDAVVSEAYCTEPRAEGCHIAGFESGERAL